MDLENGPTTLVGAKDVWEEEKDDRLDWTPEQECLLYDLVKTHGTHNWSLVAEKMNIQFPTAEKTSKQCRERWCNQLDPTLNHSPWAKQEEGQLILSHMKHKNRWCDIAADLKGRHNNMIKNRFYSIFRKVKNKVRNDDYSFKTKLELVEMHYMITVMEYYTSNPPPPNEPKRKRGKDFMYTLIEDLSADRLAIYKAALVKRAPLRAPPDEILREMLALSRSCPSIPLSVPSLPVGAAEPALPQGHSPTTSQGPRSQPQTAPRTGLASLPINTLFTLPKPNTCIAKEGVFPEEKEFIKQNAFGSSKLDTATSGAVPLLSDVSVSGFKSASAGPPSVKGGFGDCSGHKDTLVQLQPGSLGPLAFPPPSCTSVPPLTAALKVPMTCAISPTPITTTEP